jgi:hypothetical protein
MNSGKLLNIATVASAYAHVDENVELPSTYHPSHVKHPETFYVPKPGKNPTSELVEDYDKYPFELFRPYVKEVKRDSRAVYYGFCDEFMALIQKS